MVSEERIRRARDWIVNPAIKRGLRPKRSTVKVLTRTITSWRAAWMPFMARAWWPWFQPRDS